MSDAEISRRSFVKTTVAAAVAAKLSGALRAHAGAAARVADGGGNGFPVELHWLEGVVPSTTIGSTFGLPWPRGAVKADQTFALRSSPNDEPMALQTWPLAYWPDGSLKWSGHAIPAGAGLTEKLLLAPGSMDSPPEDAVKVNESPEAIEVENGIIKCRIAKRGATIVESLSRNGREVWRNARLVSLRQEEPPADENTSVTTAKFESMVEKVTVEQTGPVRAVVKLDGKHKGIADRAWLPFSVRLYFYAGSEAIRIMHTFVFDGDENKDFIRGIGLTFDVAMRDLPHDRHVRFASEGRGVWAEAVRNLCGLRRDPGETVKAAQVAGKACPPVEQFPDKVRKGLELIPAWGDFTLSQLSADGFQIRKRTKAGCGWIDAAWGHRASGTGYIGGASGGVAFGLRDFWQRHPTRLDIRNATTDAAQVTLWMWSPDAPAMDLRFYHNGMGMETHPQELEGLEITYEDYEKGWGTPSGIARSSELTLWALEATPSPEQFAVMAAEVSTPPMLAAQPAHYLSTNVFGGLWSLPDRATPAKAAIEDQLDWRFDYYRKEVEQRHWYGFWNYGDFMHTYDKDRHVWRYDVGGFAWDNSELSPDLWLWYAYLRTGRADIFRMAEAQVRHSSEVDIYHTGRFAGLGTRHGVQHWSDSAKQVRISTSAYRRFYYFLAADERVGDVMREVLDSDHKVADFDPVRKISGPKPSDYAARVNVGTDWCSFAANWLAEWERTGSAKYREKLLTGLRDIGKATHGFFSGDRFGYNPDDEDGHLYNVLGDKVSAQHLSAVFGAVEICAELIQLLDVPEFEKAWLQYCELYNAPREEQIKALGAVHGGTNALFTGHSRLTAFAAWKTGDKALAARAWGEFYKGGRGLPKVTRIEPPVVLNPIDEAAGVSTNDTAQWCLAAMQCLALIGDQIPP